MPPQQASPRAALTRSEGSPLLSLPHAVLLIVLAFLPLDTRLRCAEVCRALRDALRERSLFRRLDLTLTSGVAYHFAGDALLRAAAARGGGEVEQIDATTCPRITNAALLEVCTANAATLRHLCVPCCVALGALEALLRAAPRLETLDVHAMCEIEDAVRMLRNEAPFSPLQLRKLSAVNNQAMLNFWAGLLHPGDALALAAGIRVHPSLVDLKLEHIHLGNAAHLEAMVEAVLACRVSSLELSGCNLTAASAPAVARLICGDALTKLCLVGPLPFDTPAATLVADALRARSTLTSLAFHGTRMWDDDPNAAALLLSAVEGHRSLQAFSWCENEAMAEHRPAAGRAFGALVAANAPALTSLYLSGCALGDDGLRPVVDALQHNTHLQHLCIKGNDMSDAFAREHLLPTVRESCTSVWVGGEGPLQEELLQAANDKRMRDWQLQMDLEMEAILAEHQRQMRDWERQREADLADWRMRHGLHGVYSDDE